MENNWEKALSCAISCSGCGEAMPPESKRILSVYDHQPICLACKKKEEKRPDYDEVSKKMIGQCMIESEVMYGDPGGFCFYHFYPFTCKTGKKS